MNYRLKKQWIDRWWAMPVRVLTLVVLVPFALVAIPIDLKRGLASRKEFALLGRYLLWIPLGDPKLLR